MRVNLNKCENLTIHASHLGHGSRPLQLKLKAVMVDNTRRHQNLKKVIELTFCLYCLLCVPLTWAGISWHNRGVESGASWSKVVGLYVFHNRHDDILRDSETNMGESPVLAVPRFQGVYTVEYDPWDKQTTGVLLQTCSLVVSWVILDGTGGSIGYWACLANNLKCLFYSQTKRTSLWFCQYWCSVLPWSM